MRTLSADVDRTAPKAVQVAITSFGKPLSIHRIGDGRMFEIRMGGGGDLAAELSGSFTRYEFAAQAIKGYIESGKAKLVKDDGVDFEAKPEGRENPVLPALPKRPKLSISRPEPATEPAQEAPKQE